MDALLIAPLLAGAMVAAGLWTIGLGVVRRPAPLGKVLGAGDIVQPPQAEGLVDRAGARLATRVPLSGAVRTALDLQGRSAADFLVEKAVMALLGAGAPLLAGLACWLMGLPLPLPAWLVPALGIAGWFLPNLRLRRQQSRLRSTAGVAVFTFIDLVVLERLANQSASQALRNAACLSDTTLFRELREALERARLEQRPAWMALEEVSLRLDLPPLADVADVMRLDEQGAALGDALRARVRELRDNHLMVQKIEAQRVSESLTIWMVIPAMVFGLILLAPPLLRLVGG